MPHISFSLTYVVSGRVDGPSALAPGIHRQSFETREAAIKRARELLVTPGVSRMLLHGPSGMVFAEHHEIVAELEGKRGEGKPG